MQQTAQRIAHTKSDTDMENYTDNDLSSMSIKSYVNFQKNVS